MLDDRWCGRNSRGSKIPRRRMCELLVSLGTGIPSNDDGELVLVFRFILGDNPEAHLENWKIDRVSFILGTRRYLKRFNSAK